MVHWSESSTIQTTIWYFYYLRHFIMTVLLVVWFNSIHIMLIKVIFPVLFHIFNIQIFISFFFFLNLYFFFTFYSSSYILSMWYVIGGYFESNIKQLTNDFNWNLNRTWFEWRKEMGITGDLEIFITSLSTKKKQKWKIKNISLKESSLQCLLI